MKKTCWKKAMGMILDHWDDICRDVPSLIK